MQAYIVRQDKYRRGERWVLNIGDSALTLVRPGGQPLLEWTPEQVADRVQFPSFSQSIKYVGFDVPNIGTIQFSVDRATVKAMRAFANRGVAARGPEAVRTVFHTAVLSCLVGAILLCVGTVLFILATYQIIAGRSVGGVTDHVTFLIALSGFAILCRGMYGFYQYAQLKKLSNARGISA